jgi:rhamnose utilization protein RhaD (predicted bifunctional aldolase and dehydrogenase)
MKSLWNEKQAKEYKTDLDLRVYTSRLLGQDSSLVLHGGGNTSVKSTQTNLFGDTEDILYVKGSGWDLATIEAEGFAPVKMDMLLKMAELKELNDTDMVKYQRLAMTNPFAPNPSVEAILHAIIPYKFVDHTHADAVITITNTDGGEEKIKELYGDKVLIIPYIMPGFVLAKLIFDMTRDVKWDELEGMVLMNHGLFTFNDDAKKSYEKTIELVDKAENYLASKDAVLELDDSSAKIELLKLAQIRKEISELKACATISTFNDSVLASYFSKQNVENIATKGPLTPDHVIRTKRIPAIIGEDFKSDLASYVKEYKEYFEDNKSDETLLNPAPNFAILKNRGTLSFGKNVKEASIIKDINEHTFEAILKAEKLGGYKALSAEKIFEVEYWELEQAKLKKAGISPEFSGKVALVTSEIPSKCVDILKSRGASVVVLDVNSSIQETITQTIKNFGGIDIVVSKEKLIQETIPFLKLGIDSLAIILASTDSQILKYEDISIRVNTIIYKKNLENIPELVCIIASKSFVNTTNLEINIG